MVESDLPKKRLHRGDIMSVDTRSKLMSRIRGRGTKPELAVQAMLDAMQLAYVSHVRDLPGCPDFVVPKSGLCIFVDGDFWHGWRFNSWRLKLSREWEQKISSNRSRDARNHRRLRRLGWKVLRLWEHQVEKSPEKCVARIASRIADACPAALTPATVGRRNRNAGD